MRQNHRAGFTLLEITIAISILAVVLYLTFRVMMATQTVYSVGSVTGDVENRGRMAAEQYTNTLKYARVDAISADHSWIQFRDPLTYDDATGTIQYGVISHLPAPNDGPQVDWFKRLIFQPDEGIRETNGAPPPGGLPETEVDFSMNPDGDLVDTLVRGTVWIEYYNDLGVQLDRIAFSERVILAPSPAGFDGDIDGDGNDDFLFQVIDAAGNDVPSAAIATNGTGVTLNIWHGSFDPSRLSYHLRNNTNRVKFRNP